MSELTKRCTKCGEVKGMDMFCGDKRAKDGRRCWCKSCSGEYRLSWERRNREKRAGYWATYYAKNGPRDYIAAYPAKKSEYARRTYKRASDALTDAYVKGCLQTEMGLQRSMFPVELVNLQREQLRLHRLAKALKQAITEQQEQTA